MTSRLVISIIIFVLIFQFISCSKTEIIQSGKYRYETVKGDPLKARIYTLDNGLKVYMTVYKDEPRIQTMIPIRVGSKNDPAESTGLAHYLEHLLFKGTDQYSTYEFEKEKPLLDEVVNLYEKHSQETDSLIRLTIYKRIDSLSYAASKYAISAEYDKMLSVIGARGNTAVMLVKYEVFVARAMAFATRVVPLLGGPQTNAMGRSGVPARAYSLRSHTARARSSGVASRFSPAR